MVSRAAGAHGLKVYIPGRDGLAWETYEPPQWPRWKGGFEDVAVLAGHLSWPGVVQGLYAKEEHVASVRPDEARRARLDRSRTHILPSG